jgi:hypothetical protein
VKVLKSFIKHFYERNFQDAFPAVSSLPSSMLMLSQSTEVAWEEEQHGVVECCEYVAMQFPFV